MDEAELDRLYGLPLEEFTAERNALAKRLRGEGDRDAAAEVAKLPKPTTPAWAVNQLARSNEVQVRALLRSGDKLRDAQRAALEGGGPDALREAQKEERDVVSRLAAQARELVGPAQVDRVSETLRAAAVGDDETRELLKRGRLTRELELGGGFGALAGMPVAEPKRRKPAADTAKERAAQKQRVAGARDRLKEARATARDAEREANAAEREAAKLRRLADEAAEAVAEAERALDELQQS